ncbi:MAG: hypothetical protein EP343_22025 [Deltaproteobacteria bacterium]|nr:MAG: hypothetical protein EP343_22025 [Deltaproteobacteria bacterium]
MSVGNFDSIQLRYEQHEVVGQGGMGQVIRGYDRLNKRSVAIKTLRPDRNDDSNFLGYAFFQEVRAMASMQHKNLIEVYDFGLRHDDSMYVVMEWVEGCTLEACYNLPTPLPWPVLAYIATEVLEGLLHAHARGIVHRDLKPSNIMLRLHGASQLPEVKLIDFGIALLQEERYRHLEASLGENVLLSLPVDPPKEQRLLLTPPYGAPEQLFDPYYYRGPATDFYALGVILFQFCYNHLPFLDNKKNYSAVLDEMVSKKPPSHLPLVNDAPQDVVYLILNDLMRKEPWRRTSHAKVLLERLRQTYNLKEALYHWSALFPALQKFSPQSDPSTEIPATLPLPPRMQWRSPKDLASGQPVPNTKAVLSERRSSTLSTQMRVALHYPALVGRDDLTSRLYKAMQDHWKQGQAFIEGEADQPAKSWIVLSGSAGIGKSHLAQWALETNYEEHWMLGLQAHFHSSSATLQGIEGAIERHFGWSGATRERIEGNLLERWGSSPRKLRQTIAGIARLLRPASNTDILETGPTEERVLLDNSEARHAVRLQALEYITSPPARRRKPETSLLLWLDNLDLADAESLDFLEKLREHPQLSVMVLATVRTERVQKSHRVQQHLNEIMTTWPQAQDYRLEPLHDNAVRALLQQWLPLSPLAQDKACQRSQGNPLFALQHIYAWAQTGALSWEPNTQEYALAEHALQTLPETTQSHWAERLQGLSEAAQFVAKCLTSLGSELLPAVVDQLLLKLCQSEELLSGVDTDALLHELLHHQLLLSEYRRLVWYHGMLEEYLDTQLRKHPRAHSVFQAAFHALAHHPQPQQRGVVRLRAKAALAAQESEQAFSLLMSFIEEEWRLHRDSRAVLEDLDLLHEQVPEGSRAYYWRWRTEVLLVQTELEEAAQACQKLFLLADVENNPLEQAHGLRLQASLLDTLGKTDKGPEGGREQALELANQALEFFHQLDDLPDNVGLVGQAECRLVLSNIEYNRSMYSQSTSWAQSALVAFEQCDLPRGASQSSLLLGFNLADQGRYTEAEDWLEQLAQRFDELGEIMGVAQCQFCLGWLALYRQQWAVGKTLAAQVQHSFASHNQHWWYGVASLLRGWLEAATDNLPQAQAYTQTAHKAFETIGGMPHEQGHVMLLEANIALRQGQKEEALAHVLKVVELQRPEPLLQQAQALTLALYHQEQGQHQEAWAAFQKATGFWRSHSLTAFGVPCILKRLRHSEHWPRSARLDLEAWLRSLQLH